jgi:CBS domain containing-hemolysin-like protein
MNNKGVNCLSEAPSGNGKMGVFFRLIKRLIFEKKVNQESDMNHIHQSLQSPLIPIEVEKSNLHEDELILRSISFKEKIISDILTPRTQVTAIDINDPIDKIRDLFLKECYSRIPVYENNIDQIIGVVSEREFLTQLIQEERVNIRKLIRRPIFVMETMKISTVLSILQKENAHLAIVVDEFGGTSGIVTLEDILEELVGEIRDEFDEQESECIQINENEYRFLASISLSSFFHQLKMKLPNTRYLTLGGWLFEGFKHVPIIGESIQYKNLTFIINEIQNRRIQSVIVKINNNNQNLQSKLGS